MTLLVIAASSQLRRLFWQENRKYGASSSGSNTAAQRNFAAVFLHDFLGNPKPQSGAYILLGGIERLKKFLAMVLSYAAAAIGDNDSSARTM
jgi:hypothetical protein